jgi:hypothetical protein
MADTPADIKAATIAAIMGPEHGLYDRVSRALLAERTAQAERIRELEEALREINGLVAAPRNSSDNHRLYAALDALDKARALARSALGGNNG